jgi:hypothetical protein
MGPSTRRHRIDGRQIRAREDRLHKGRVAAGRKAIGNTGDEIRMRAELADAVAGVLAGMDPAPTTVTDQETGLLLAAADLVTLARTGVEYSYNGDVIDAHAPEMPTRFAKELTQIIRGAVAIGMDRQKALRLAIRCARDTMPPLRLAIIDDLASNPGSTVVHSRSATSGAAHAGVLDVLEKAYGDRTRWHYSLVGSIDPKAIDPDSSPDLSVSTPSPNEERGRESDECSPVTDKASEDDPHESATVYDFESLLNAPDDTSCSYCGLPLNAFQAADGVTIHPDCAEVAKLEETHP